MTSNDPFAEPTLEEAAEVVARAWWIPLVLGIAFVVFGVVMLFDLSVGARTVAILVGIFLIANGVMDLFSDARGWGRALGIILGLLLIAGGIIAIVWPGVTLWAVAVVFGITLIVSGVFRIVAAAVVRGHLWGWVLLLGLLETAVGVLALVWPEATAYVILVFIGCYAIVGGLIAIFMAFRIRQAPQAVAQLERESGPVRPAF